MKIGKIIGFVIEVAIPVVVAPILPNFIKECTEAQSFIIGSCISIFLAIWQFALDFSDKNDAAVADRSREQENFASIHKSFTHLEEHVSVIESLLELSRQLDKITSPYFRHKVNSQWLKSINQFKADNEQLLSGYYETSPYSSDTYGVDGIRMTKKKILAVSSISDYWDRNNFVEDYLKAQYDLIANSGVSITRIFIGTQEHLLSIEPLMRDQKRHGISVYYIISDSDFFSEKWKGQDFLIQDDSLLVDILGDTHKPNDNVKEIIVTRKKEVDDKTELFNSILHNSKELPKGSLSDVFLCAAH